MLPDFPKKLWEGKIPACFELASHEVQSTRHPGPYYFMLPRNSYLTIFAQPIREHFKEYIDMDCVDEVWFEYKEKSLRWHYPCGLLYDMYCDTKGSDLPWCITVHFKNFPSELIRCQSLDAVESHFMTMLKEADQLKHKGQVIGDMNKNQHQQLWHGLRTDNFDEFWSINKKFMEGYESNVTFKHIPIRVYYNGRVIQNLISAQSNDNEDDNIKTLTLHDAVKTSVPQLLENVLIEDIKSKIIIQGVCPPLSTSLQWLSENMAYADNFLHICILPS